MSTLSSATTATRPRVLIVEDDAVQAVDMEFAFEDAGYEVVGPVNTVSGALDLIERHRPTMAALDVQLRRETTVPVAQAMRAAGGRIVFVTAGPREDALDAVPDAQVMRKPCDPRRVVAALAN